MVHGYQSPVGDYASNANSVGVFAGGSRAGDQVFDCSGVEELDVGELEHLAQKSRREQSRVLDGDPLAVVLVRDANLVEEQVGGLAHDHGAEELAAEPCTSTRSNTGLDDGDLEVRALGRKHESSGKTAGSGSNNNDVRLGVGVEVFEVATGCVFVSLARNATLMESFRTHGPGHLTLTDGGKRKVVPVIREISHSLCLTILANRDSLDSEVLLEVNATTENGRSRGLEDGSRGRHGVRSL